MKNKVDLSIYSHVVFNSTLKKLRYFSWLCISNMFFLTNIPFPQKFKVLVLKFFGANIGKKCVIKPWVKIKFPWELSLGDHVWLGEEVWIDNISNVQIGNNVCISQGAMLLTGNHRYDKIDFALETKPIIIEDGVWICAKAIILGGIKLENHAVVGLACVAKNDLAPYSILQASGDIKIRTID